MEFELRASDMDSKNLEFEGFQRWIKLDLRNMGEFDLDSCIYVFRVNGKREHYKRGFSDIVYIGETGRPLVCRMWDYLNPCKNLESPKRQTAKRIQNYVDKGNEIEVAWKMVDKTKTKGEEEKLKNKFRMDHQQLPILQKR